MTQVEPVRNPKTASAPAAVSLQATPLPSPNTAPPFQSPASAAEIGRNILTQFDRLWQKTQADSEKRIKALSPESRKLVELQSTVQRLGLGSQLLTQTAEAVNGTIRRVQQLGAGS